MDVEVRRRIQAGANAWRNVEGVMVDRKISRKLKGKVLDSCVVPASTYGLETLALSELHQHKLQVCGKNWIRRIAGIKRVERRRMKDLSIISRHKNCNVDIDACVVTEIYMERTTLQISLKYSNLEPIFGRIVDIRLCRTWIMY